MREWQTKILDEVCIKITDGSHYSPKTIDSGFPYITVRDIGSENDQIDFENCKFIGENDFRDLEKKGCKPVKGDVLFSKDGTVGKVSLVDYDKDFVVLSSLAIIRPNSEIIDSAYLKYLLKAPFFLKQAIGKKTGVAILRVVLKNLKTIPVPFPLLLEQKRIAAILDEAFEGIAAAVTNTEKNLANARKLFESYLNAVFTQKGEGWVEKTLKQVSDDFGRGKSKHRPRNDPKLYSGPYPFIQTGDVRNCDHLILTSSQSYNKTGLAQSKLWPKGTICITIAANIAETGILDFDACFPDSIIGIVVDETQTNNDFVEYLLQSMKARIKAKGKGSAQDNINLATFENELFSFPSLEEQDGIVVRLNALSANTTNLEAIYQQKLAALAKLKQSILQKAFAGEFTLEIKSALPDKVTKAVEIKTTSPEFTANVLAFAYHRHAAKQRDRTFGRVKAQKTLHLVESIGGVDLGRMPLKDAAGPNDFQHMLRAEEWAKENQFFKFVGRGSGYDFKKLSRYKEMIAGAFATIKPYREELDRVLYLVVPMNTSEAELFATVHAAWNNLILDGAEINDEAIIRAARNNWHPNKMEVPEIRFRKAIRKIRKKGLIPDGKAKRVGGQESLF